jgi:hypothetical protein
MRYTIEIPFLKESNRHLNGLLPWLEEKDFRLTLTTHRNDRIILWFERVSDRRRYALSLWENGPMRLRKHDADETQVTVFESRRHEEKEFNSLLAAFRENEKGWLGYEIDPAVYS